MQESRVADLADVVEAGVEGLEVEAITEGVIVPDLVNLVVVNVQPLQRLGDEGKIEPPEAVGGHVEPAEVLHR